MSLAFNLDAAWALLLVIGIDLALSADNAVVIALAATALPPAQRPKVIAVGTLAAALIRMLLSVVAQRLLGIVGLLAAGGILLLYVAWKLWRELREDADDDQAEYTPAADGQNQAAGAFRRAAMRIVLADISMSIDNVLAVAGAARDHLVVLIVGLALSVLLTAVAAGFMAKLMDRFRWVGYLGVALIAWVALEMIWDGGLDLWTRFHG